MKFDKEFIANTASSNGHSVQLRITGSDEKYIDNFHEAEVSVVLLSLAKTLSILRMN